ncbi:unnamed protein product [Tilletia controversa]|nr:unnamed protein product [Tilletia controversa]
MKYLDYPQFAELSRALSFTSSECTVFTRIEAYSCKPVAQEKRLYKHIQRVYAPELAARKYGHDDDGDDSSSAPAIERTASSPRIGAHSSAGSVPSSIPAHLADSPFGNLGESSSARKLLFTVIATLNAAFPDHDFADIPVSTFRREPSPAYVVHSLSSTLQSLRRNAAGNNPDAPAAAATSPPNPGSSAARSSTAFLSAAPRTFAGLPTTFDSSPTTFSTNGGSGASRGVGSPSIAATLSPPGQIAQLSLGERQHSFSSSSSALPSSSTVPTAIALPPPVSNAQATTYPSHARSAHDTTSHHTDQRSNSFSRSPKSPRLNATTSPRMGAAVSYPSPSHLPAAINAATHPALASILDDIMCVEECEVYSFHPDIEYDPHASADDDEERLLGAVGGGAGGGLGLFDEEEGAGDDRGIEIGPANDDLEDIAETWAEDAIEEDGDPMRPEQTARSQRTRERVTEAGRRAVKDLDGDEEMDEQGAAEADDALLFDEDVYGQGLSGNQTPRAPDHQEGTARAGLSSDASSSHPFPSSVAAAYPDDADGDASMADDSHEGSASPPKARRALGPADRSLQGGWGRPISSESSQVHSRINPAHALRHDDDDDEDETHEDEFLTDADLYADDFSDRSAVEAAEKDEDDDVAGLLWATYAFFYNKRLKRVLFVSVWARTNSGVEAHAAAAAAAARARERVMRMSTSPSARSFGGGGLGVGVGGSTSSSWPGLGGKASNWSGLSPAQRAISASTQARDSSSGSHHSGGGGFAAKASRGSGSSPTHLKKGDSGRGGSSATSSSSSRKSSGRKESSLSKKTRREASSVGASRASVAGMSGHSSNSGATSATTTTRRWRSSLGQSVITSSSAAGNAGEREGSGSRGTTPVAATPMADMSAGGTGTNAGSGSGTGTGPSMDVSGAGSVAAPSLVDALRAVPTPSSRHDTSPPPSARSPFPHASPHKPGEAAARTSSTGAAPVDVPGASAPGDDTSFSTSSSSIPSSWQSNTSSAPIPIGGRSTFGGSMPSLDGAVLSASASAGTGAGVGVGMGGTPGSQTASGRVLRQLSKRLHPDQAGDPKRPRVAPE